MQPEVLDDSNSLYVISPIRTEFRQGEIISNVSQWSWASQEEELLVIEHPFVIIASQDCDLLQDFSARSQGKQGDLNGVLLYEAHKTFGLKAALPGSDVWRRVIRNNDERYHALQASSADFDREKQGIPDLIVDFKRFFTISVVELTRQCEPTGAARRRCILKEPYKEHFQSRAAFYIQRVGLPRPHRIVSPPVNS
jgi:hypothetical protein